MTIQYDNTTNSISVVGTETNLPVNIQTKGTGALNLAAGSSGVNISNGGTVTAITGTAGGSYTTVPTITISAPTTAGGVQATGTVGMAQLTTVIAGGGTGYTVNDVLSFVGGTGTAVTVTVTTVSSGVITGFTVANSGTYTVLPTNPISVTGGTGSGATFNVNAWQVRTGGFTITGAGSGYVEQPTITFSSGSAAAYAVVGAIPIIKSLNTQLSVQTVGGEVARFRADPSAVANGRLDFSVDQFNRGIITGINTLVLTSAGTNSVSIQTASTAQQQLVIAHTASAVNYIQATGAATGSSVVLSSQGSDTNVGFQIRSRGTGDVNLMTAGGNNQVVVRNGGNGTNFLGMRGGNTGIAVSIAAEGSDTNIPLVLQPKGTGALQAQQTDSTTAGGNARGTNAVDWQTNRGSASQVASGQNTFIGGGTNNTVTGAIAGVLSGGFNAVTAQYAVVAGGAANNANQYGAGVVAGQSNIASGYFNFIGGGQLNSGTSVSAVTTQSGTMNGTTAVTLSASNASIKVGQLITGTSIASFTYVAAISGTSLTLSQAASGSSTSTLSFFTPFGTVVGGGNNQATGSYSFIGGGGNAGTAAQRNLASGDWSVVTGGSQNTASGSNSSVLGGGNCSATSSFATCLGGAGNTASGFGSTNLGGNGNVANGTYAVASGFGSTNRSLPSFSFAAGTASVNGDAQTQIFVLRNTTTDATATALTANATAPSTTNQVILPNNSAYFFRGEVISGVTGGGDTKGWTIEGVIKRGAGVGTTALVGTPTVTSSFADAGASTWDIAVTADTTNGGLRVTFTGQAATTIRTVAQIRTTEMTY